MGVARLKPAPERRGIRKRQVGVGGEGRDSDNRSNEGQRKTPGRGERDGGARGWSEKRGEERKKGGRFERNGGKI
ncbi:MAG: hypothetical protein WBK32_00990 [Candidatus Saccharicenans sp.]